MNFSLLQKRWGALCALQAFIAVAAGAFGAHGLKHLVTEQSLTWWQTACQYLMYHSLAGLILVGLAFYSARFIVSVRLFTLGNVLFAGSLCLMTLTGIKMLGAITPIGGVMYLLGWLLAIRTFVTIANKPAK